MAKAPLSLPTCTAAPSHPHARQGSLGKLDSEVVPEVSSAGLARTVPKELVIVTIKQTPSNCRASVGDEEGAPPPPTPLSGFLFTAEQSPKNVPIPSHYVNCLAGGLPNSATREDCSILICHRFKVAGLMCDGVQDVSS